jgi:hypothetical protein
MVLLFLCVLLHEFGHILTAPAIGVVDAGGKLIGLVTGETIAETMMLQNSLPKGVQIGPWTQPPSSKAA